MSDEILGLRLIPCSQNGLVPESQRTIVSGLALSINLKGKFWQVCRSDIMTERNGCGMSTRAGSCIARHLGSVRSPLENEYIHCRVYE